MKEVCLIISVFFLQVDTVTAVKYSFIRFKDIPPLLYKYRLHISQVANLATKFVKKDEPESAKAQPKEEVSDSLC